jgi:hypothetical protein
VLLAQLPASKIKTLLVFFRLFLRPTEALAHLLSIIFAICKTGEETNEQQGKIDKRGAPRAARRGE